MAVLRYRHRDRGQPLSQQRRRIGGIVGGGDTPEKKHYKILLNNPDKELYVAGEIKDETFVFYGLGPDIWRINGNGIIDSISSGTEGFVTYVLLPQIQKAGYNVIKYDIQENQKFEVGYQFQNFEKFVLIP